ncbi:bifunctional diguanylate cyclase/phosphodiesterase [Halovulum marinum]|nr:EAL domain-containing protein [Halovulum marinum]
MHYPVPENESARLASLLDLGLQDATGSPEFDAIANLAADVLECPMALISLIGESEQWFKARFGLDADVSPRELAFCNYTILDRQPLIVSDARKDARFRNNPLVVGEPNLVFYAGAPISIDGTHNLGTLCVLDTRPRRMSDLQMKRLRSLARAAEGLIAAYSSRRQAERARLSEQTKGQELTRVASLLDQITKLSGVGGWELELAPQKLTWTDETKRIHEVPPDFEPQLDGAIDFYAPEAQPLITRAMNDALHGGASWDLELPMVTAKGRQIWVRAAGGPTYKDGVMVSLIGAFQDISERKRTEARIRDSETAAHARTEELRTVLDNMEEGVSVFDADANLTIWNRKYIEIFGKPAGEVYQGVPFRRLLEREMDRGDFTGDIDKHLRELSDRLDRQVSVVCQLRTNSSRIINSTHAPLPGGGWVGTHSDVTDRVLEAERTEHASRHDALTGLPNRLAFNARMDAIRAENHASDRSLVLMLVDLDRFKEANDTFGHLVGDALLKGTADRLRACVRKGDLVARLGGDEFAIVIECDRRQALALAERIAGTVSQEMRRPFAIDGNRPAIGASIGFCVVPADDFEVDEIMTRADGALYKVKADGRGGYQVYDEALTEQASALRRQRTAVDAAVRLQNLELEFQPIYDLRSRRLCGAEALVRPAQRGVAGLCASELLRIAEETGTIDEIGSWILEESLREAAGWNADLSVSVDVSPRQLGTGRLHDRIRDLLEHLQFPAARLELEIPEGAFLSGDAGALGELHDIRALGARIVLDDFGSANASLACLRHFPFDKIKIDRSFVGLSATESHARAMIGALVTLATDLGMQTTAAGIATADCLRDIAALGCTFGQGRHLSRPLSARAFRKSSLPLRDVA